MASDLDFILGLLLFLLPKIGYSYPEALITARNYINLPVQRPTPQVRKLVVFFSFFAFVHINFTGYWIVRVQLSSPLIG